MNVREPDGVAVPVAPQRQPGPVPRGRVRGQAWVVVAIAVVGVLVTAVMSWSAWRVDRSSERRLLQVQAEQAAAVLSAAIVGIEAPVRTALEVATVTDGSVNAFLGFVSPLVGASGPFVSASLWQISGGNARLLASRDQPAAPASSKAQRKAVVARAARTTSLVVAGITVQSSKRIGYALAEPGPSTYVVYAERAVPADRRAPAAFNAAFLDLHYATYLGARVSPAALETTDLPLSRLPFTGETARVTIPFGDNSLTLVTTSSRTLQGNLSERLWWIVLTGGLLLTAAAVVVAAGLIARRRRAESDAATIQELYVQLDAAYSEQRSVSEELQHALLPNADPSIPGLEIATRYVAGARGVEVGGDWYSIIRLDEHRYGFVVGDVSGRGINAATIMARVRSTIDSYVAEGHAPHIALELASARVDLRTDRHIVTVLVGVGDLRSGQIALASAGHLAPLILAGGSARYLDMVSGVPLGVMTTSYPPNQVLLDPGDTLLAYTDGLVERRGEGIDIGLARLSSTITATDGPLEATLTQLLDNLVGADAEDDVAILAVRPLARDESGRLVR